MNMLDLKLHETVNVAGTNMQITRVHGGFAYCFCEDVVNSDGQCSYQYNYLFVPLCTERSRPICSTQQKQ